MPDTIKDSELIDPIVRAYPQDVMGCTNAKRNVMLAVMPAHGCTDKPAFLDLFLTQNAAIKLHAELGRAIATNTEEGLKYQPEPEPVEEEI